MIHQQSSVIFIIFLPSFLLSFFPSFLPLSSHFLPCASTTTYATTYTTTFTATWITIRIQDKNNGVGDGKDQVTDGVEFGSWIRESKDSFRDSLSGILPTGILSTGFDFGDSLEDSFLGFFFRDSFSGILSQGCFEGFFDIQILSMDSSRDTSRDSFK